MSIPCYHIDAFTGRIFSGNPAAVCILDAWLHDAVMQSIAAEHNLSETAFVVRRGDVFDLRWFTPAVEVDLCGHATLATAHALYMHGAWSAERIDFDTRSGRLGVVRDGDLYLLDFPSRPAQLCEPPSLLLQGLGVTPRFIGKARDYLAVFDTEEEVAALRPDMGALANLDDTLGIIATAPGKNSDFVSRFFAPGAGIPEDPVTGSAHSTLIPYWAAKLGRDSLHALQISRRGGELFCELRGDRVRIGGRAVTFSSGTIHLPHNENS